MTQFLVYLLLAHGTMNTIPTCLNQSANAIAGNWPYVAAVAIQQNAKVASDYVVRTGNRAVNVCTDRP